MAFAAASIVGTEEDVFDRLVQDSIRLSCLNGWLPKICRYHPLVS
jgi:hypothetical protein